MPPPPPTMPDFKNGTGLSQGLPEGITNATQNLQNLPQLPDPSKAIEEAKQKALADAQQKAAEQLKGILPQGFDMSEILQFPGADFFKLIIKDIIQTSIGEETKIMMDELKAAIIKNVPELFKSGGIKNASYNMFNIHVSTYYKNQLEKLDINNYKTQIDAITDETKKQELTNKIQSLLDEKINLINDAIKALNVVVGGGENPDTTSNETSNETSDTSPDTTSNTIPDTTSNTSPDTTSNDKTSNEKQPVEPPSADILMNITKSVLTDSIGKETREIMIDVKDKVIACIPGVIKDPETEKAAIQGFNDNIPNYFNEVLEKFDEVLKKLNDKDKEIQNILNFNANSNASSITGGKRKTKKRGMKKGKTRRRIYRGIV